MKLSFQQKVLLSIGVVAGIGALAGAGTFATFTAETDNDNSTFANGTLVLSNSVDGATACLSTGGGDTDTNVNSGCDAAFDLSIQKPGDSDTFDITLENMGSLAASALKGFSASCTPGDASGETYHGTGDPCGVIQLTLQQYSDAFTTESTCLYGGAVGNVCDWSNTGATLTAFVGSHADVASGVSAGGLAAHSGGTTDTAWVRVGVKLLSTADNTYQGRSATMSLNWHITQ